MKSIMAMGLVVLVAACDPTSPADDAGPVDAGTGDAGSGNLCDPVVVACEDQMIQQLSLHDTVSTGEVTTTESGGVFTTVVDASAGGSSNAINNPFVYLKFNTDGAVKVAIDDEAALASQDWDLAARRFIVRLNSGDSGPSCVAAAELSTPFDDVSAPPLASAFAIEDFYSDTCTYVTDSRFSGFDGPDSLLKTFWEMNGMCIATTGVAYVLRLADGRHLRLVIDAYYASGQEGCNSSGTAGTGSGVLTLRWAWLS